MQTQVQRRAAGGEHLPYMHLGTLPGLNISKRHPRLLRFRSTHSKPWKWRARSGSEQRATVQKERSPCGCRSLRVWRAMRSRSQLCPPVPPSISGPSSCPPHPPSPYPLPLAASKILSHGVCPLYTNILTQDKTLQLQVTKDSSNNGFHKCFSLPGL